MSPGKVTESLVARIRRQVDEHGLVLWLDPERQYENGAELLAEDGVPVETYRDSIRQKLDLSGGTRLAHYATQWVLEKG